MLSQALSEDVGGVVTSLSTRRYRLGAIGRLATTRFELAPVPFISRLLTPIHDTLQGGFVSAHPVSHDQWLKTQNDA